MGGRGVIGDKWSMRVLWVCALGSAIGIALNLLTHEYFLSKYFAGSLYMVAQERQLQNRERMLAESLKDMESEGSGENI